VNLWKTPWTLEDVHRAFPNAVVVHGGFPSQFPSRDHV